MYKMYMLKMYAAESTVGLRHYTFRQSPENIKSNIRTVPALIERFPWSLMIRKGRLDQRLAETREAET